MDVSATAIEPLPFDPADEHTIYEQTPGWYEKWRKRIYQWVSRATDETIAGIVLLVPDLFMLLVRLIQDGRVPFIVKAHLVLAAAYVLSPIDFLPEAIAGVVGLTDDAGVMALVLMWIKNIMGVDPTILRQHWAGADDPGEVIENLHRKIVDNADKLFKEDVWRRMQARFKNPDVIFIDPDIPPDETEKDSGRKGLFSRFSRRAAPAQKGYKHIPIS